MSSSKRDKKNNKSQQELNVTNPNFRNNIQNEIYLLTDKLILKPDDENSKTKLKNIFNKYITNEKVINFCLQTINNIIILKDNTSKHQILSLIPEICEINPKTFCLHVDLILAIFQNCLSGDNSSYFSQISQNFGDIVKLLIDKMNYDLNKKNNQQQKILIYTKFKLFCLTNIKSNNQYCQVSGILCLTSFIENCSFNYTNFENLKNIVGNLCNEIKNPKFKEKLEILNCFISLIFCSEDKYIPFAVETLNIIIEFINDTEWLIRKFSLNIIYTLLCYCKDEIITQKEKIIHYLNELLRKEKIIEIKEIIEQIYNLLDESDYKTNLYNNKIKFKPDKFTSEDESMNYKYNYSDMLEPESEILSIGKSIEIKNAIQYNRNRNSINKEKKTKQKSVDNRINIIRADKKIKNPQNKLKTEQNKTKKTNSYNNELPDNIKKNIPKNKNKNKKNKVPYSRNSVDKFYEQLKNPASTLIKKKPYNYKDNYFISQQNNTNPITHYNLTEKIKNTKLINKPFNKQNKKKLSKDEKPKKKIHNKAESEKIARGRNQLTKADIDFNKNASCEINRNIIDKIPSFGPESETNLKILEENIPIQKINGMEKIKGRIIINKNIEKNNNINIYPNENTFSPVYKKEFSCKNMTIKNNSVHSINSQKKNNNKHSSIERNYSNNSFNENGMNIHKSLGNNKEQYSKDNPNSNSTYKYASSYKNHSHRSQSSQASNNINNIINNKNNSNYNRVYHPNKKKRIASLNKRNHNNDSLNSLLNNNSSSRQSKNLKKKIYNNSFKGNSKKKIKKNVNRSFQAGNNIKKNINNYITYPKNNRINCNINKKKLISKNLQKYDYDDSPKNFIDNSQFIIQSNPKNLNFELISDKEPMQRQFNEYKNETSRIINDLKSQVNYLKTTLGNFEEVAKKKEKMNLQIKNNDFSGAFETALNIGNIQEIYYVIKKYQLKKENDTEIGYNILKGVINILCTDILSCENLRLVMMFIIKNILNKKIVFDKETNTKVYKVFTDLYNKRMELCFTKVDLTIILKISNYFAKLR